MKKEIFAFTLAEILITLAVIGIVAAMTMPTLISSYQKKSTAAKVKKFYSVINNTVKHAVADNGDVVEWMGTAGTTSYEDNLAFVQKYFFPYLIHNDFDNCYENAVCIYLPEGGMFFFRYDLNGGDISYFVNGKFENTRRNNFTFQFNKSAGGDEEGNPIIRDKKDTSVEPYTYGWNGDYDKLWRHSVRGCRKNLAENIMGDYCTKVLQINNWEFPKKYPW